MSQVLAATLADGRLQVWFLDEFGKLTSRRQTTVGTDARWTEWSSFSNPGVKYLTAASLPRRGRAVLLGANEFQRLWMAHQVSVDTNAGWSEWQPFPGPTFASGIEGIALGHLEDGRLQVMMVTDFQDLWVTRMVGIDLNDGWSDWTKL